MPWKTVSIETSITSASMSIYTSTLNIDQQTIIIQLKNSAQRTSLDFDHSFFSFDRFSIFLFISFGDRDRCRVNRPRMAYPPQMGAMFGSIPSYKVKDFHVFFGDRYLANAQWLGFEDLGQGYGSSISLCLSPLICQL